jgi:hypothetical protein
MTKVSAHKFKGNYTDKEVEENLEFLRSTLASRLETGPAAMGKQVVAQFSRGCFAHSLGRSKDAFEMFQASSECAGAQFAATSAEPKTSVAFGFRGRTLTGPSGPPQFASEPPSWIGALLLAVAQQQPEVVETLLAVPTAVLQNAPGEVDACYIHLVHALKAFFRNQDAAAHLAEFERLSRPEALKISTATSIERFRAIGSILSALAKRDDRGVNDALVKQLEAHKKFFGKGKEAGSASGLIDPQAAGLMRTALDRGLKLDVESDYVPKWLIGLEKP